MAEVGSEASADAYTDECCPCIPCNSTVEMSSTGGDPLHPPDGCEEGCCPDFWFDENSIRKPNPPPIPLFSIVFDPANTWLNDNSTMTRFGKIGFRHADAQRKRVMGLAMALTVFAIPVTVFGCVGAGSHNPHVLVYTNWVWGLAFYNNQTTCDGGLIEIGLRTIQTEICQFGKCDDSLLQSFDNCQTDNVYWNRAANYCDEHDDANHYKGFMECSVVQKCFEVSSGRDVFDWFGSQEQNAYVSCFTLIFALMGCITRIRWRQDTNFQKAIGCFPDTFSAITGASGLYKFISRCYNKLPAETNGHQNRWGLGPGYMAFWFCWGAQVIRAFLHWILPVPHAVAARQFFPSRYSGSTKSLGQVFPSREAAPPHTAQPAPEVAKPRTDVKHYYN